MNKLRKLSLLFGSGLLMLTLLGGTPIRPKMTAFKISQASKLIAYQAQALVLEDSIHWYRNNWKLNNNILHKKHQSEEARSWK